MYAVLCTWTGYYLCCTVWVFIWNLITWWWYFGWSNVINCPFTECSLLCITLLSFFFAFFPLVLVEKKKIYIHVHANTHTHIVLNYIDWLTEWMKCSCWLWLYVIVIKRHMRNSIAFVTHNSSLQWQQQQQRQRRRRRQLSTELHIYSMYPVLVVEATNAIRKSREG